MHVDQTVYETRPGGDKISQVERPAYDLLDELGIPFCRVEHDAAATVDDCAAVEDVLGIEICKNLFLTNRQQTDFYLLMMPGHKAFKTKELSTQVGSSRLSFGNADQMQGLLGVAPGSVSVLGLANDKEHRVKLLIDGDLLESEFFGCHPCKNTASLKLKLSDLLDKILPTLGYEPTFVELGNME